MSAGLTVAAKSREAAAQFACGVVPAHVLMSDMTMARGTSRSSCTTAFVAVGSPMRTGPPLIISEVASGDG